MPRKKKDPNAAETVKVPTGIQETELSFLETCGPQFKSGVEKVRAMNGEIETAMSVMKAKKKEQRQLFRKLRKTARTLAEAGL